MFGPGPQAIRIKFGIVLREQHAGTRSPSCPPLSAQIHPLSQLKSLSPDSGDDDSIFRHGKGHVRVVAFLFLNAGAPSPCWTGEQCCGEHAKWLDLQHKPYE